MAKYGKQEEETDSESSLVFATAPAAQKYDERGGAAKRGSRVLSEDVSSAYIHPRTTTVRSRCASKGRCRAGEDATGRDRRRSGVDTRDWINNIWPGRRKRCPIFEHAHIGRLHPA